MNQPEVAEWAKDFLETPVMQRLFAAESMAMVHGMGQWTGKTIQEELSSHEEKIRAEIADVVKTHEVREEPVGGVIGWSKRVDEIEMFRRSILSKISNTN